VVLITWVRFPVGSVHLTSFFVLAHHDIFYGDRRRFFFDVSFFLFSHCFLLLPLDSWSKLEGIGVLALTGQRKRTTALRQPTRSFRSKQGKQARQLQEQVAKHAQCVMHGRIAIITLASSLVTKQCLSLLVLTRYDDDVRVQMLWQTPTTHISSISFISLLTSKSVIL
jgi:hypothetical protein